MSRPGSVICAAAVAIAIAPRLAAADEAVPLVPATPTAATPATPETPATRPPDPSGDSIVQVPSDPNGHDREQPFRPPTGPDMVISIPGERSTTNKIVVISGVAATAIAGGLGLYWHLDSRSASNDVSTGTFAGHAWTAARADEVARADTDRTRATIAYSIGGALLIGTIITYIITEPRTETQVIHPHAAMPTVIPAPGGALLGGAWSF